MNTAEKLLTVAENTLKVYDAGQKSVGVRETVTGNPALLDYVHPTEHEMDVRVESKNLFDVTKNCASNNIMGNVSYDGDVITAELLDGQLYINRNKKVIYPAGTYTMTVFPMSENVAMGFWTYDANGGTETFVGGMSEVMNAPKSVTLTFDYDFAICICGNSKSKGTHSFKIQIEKGTTATEYTPHIADLSTVKVTKCGKNLFDKDNTTCLLNGYISGSGAYMSASSGEKSFIFKCSPHTDYVVSKLVSLTNRVAGFSSIPNSGTVGTFLGEYINKTSYTFNSVTAEYIVVWYFNNSGETYTADEILDSIQLEYGKTATDYEPYVGGEYTATADGSVSGVRSISPVTMLTADGVTITAEYYLDAKSKISDIEQTLLDLGGSL